MFRHPIAHKVLLASTAITGSSNTHSNPQKVDLYKEGVFMLHCSAIDGASTLDVDVETYDITSKQWFVIGSFAQVTAADTYTTLRLSNCLGERIALNYTFAAGTSITVSVAVNLKAG